MVKTFLYLIYNGLTAKDEGEASDDEDNQDEREFGFEGAGMGEGKGTENMSKEIEHEEQVEGLEDQKPEDQQEPDKPEKDAFDMQNDFDG